MSALPRRFARGLPLLLAGLLLVAGTVSAGHVSRESSPTWDETHFFGIGYYLILTGRFDIPGVGIHPPLAHYLGALPLLGERIPLAVFGAIGPGGKTSALVKAHVKRGNALLAQLGFEAFLRARWPFIVLYALLGLFVFLWSRRIWGAAAGLFSLALYLCSPTLLAHGFLLTNDFTLASLLFVAIFCLALALEAPSLAALGGFVIAAALAPAVRVTGLLLGPLAALTVLVHALRRSSSAGETALAIWLPRRGRVFVSPGRFLGYWAVLGLLTLLVSYLALVALYQGQWDLASFRTNLRLVSALFEHGHVVFLDGQTSFAGFTRYYLVALLYKTPLALLLAWGLALALPVRWLGQRRWLPLVLAAAFVATLSLLRYTLGLRYVLLAYPLLFVAAGRLLAVAPPALWPRWPRLVAAGALVLLALAELASAYPYPRAYANPLFVRGPKHAALADMDLDWGEGLIALRRYVRKHAVRDFALSYHGSVAPELFDLHPVWYENPSRQQAPRGQRPRRGLFFISSTNLSGVYGGSSSSAALQRERPIDVVGGTIYVFRLEQLAGARARRPATP